MRLSKRTRPRRIGDFADTIFRAFRVHEQKASDLEAADCAAAVLAQLYPMTFAIHRVIEVNGSFFAARLGPAATVCEAPTLEAVMDKLAVYRREQGFDARRFPLKAGLVEEDLRDKLPSDLSEFTVE